MSVLFAVLLLGALPGCGDGAGPVPGSPSVIRTTRSAGDPGACVTAPAVTFQASGQPVRPLPPTRAVAVTLALGQSVAVTFRGSCTDGGRLEISDDARSFTTAATSRSERPGEAREEWTATTRGEHWLQVIWSCGGPVSCPLTFLGTINVTTA